MVYLGVTSGTTLYTGMFMLQVSPLFLRERWPHFKGVRAELLLRYDVNWVPPIIQRLSKVPVSPLGRQGHVWEFTVGR